VLLATFLTHQGPRAAVRSNAGAYFDLAASDPSLPASIRELLAAGESLLQRAKQLATQPHGVVIPADAKRLAPIIDPPKILCIGLNYRDHAIESGQPIPSEPVVFGKFGNALAADGDPIIVPKVSSKTDYEAELVVVIGRRGKHIAEAVAMNHVAGYTVGHDVSARDWQFKGDAKQWILGKTFDTFAPIGPDLVTADQIADPHQLPIRLRLNGTVMQESSTKEFIFGIPALIAYLSQVATLEPGDLIFTGTPPGVGAARKPPVFLKGGDVAEVEIDGVGLLRNPVQAEA
jgi:2-keto-4-pentenoate hydratase/2-oxohepta-3-ene-1,7-dioic acid hydratase in catechol pathway